MYQERINYGFNKMNTLMFILMPVAIVCLAATIVAGLQFMVKPSAASLQVETFVNKCKEKDGAFIMSSNGRNRTMYCFKKDSIYIP